MLGETGGEVNAENFRTANGCGEIHNKDLYIESASGRLADASGTSAGVSEPSAAVNKSSAQINESFTDASGTSAALSESFIESN
jgi:hypothetical protein